MKELNNNQAFFYQSKEVLDLMLFVIRRVNNLRNLQKHSDSNLDFKIDYLLTESEQDLEDAYKKLQESIAWCLSENE